MGDLTGLDLDAVLAASLGGWTGDAAGPVTTPAAVAGDTGRVVIVDRPGAVQTQLLIGRTGPDRHDRVWPALLLGTYCLGGTLTSRLDRVLREEKGYTYGVRAFQRVLRSPAPDTAAVRRVCRCSPSAVLWTRPPLAPRWMTCGRCCARWPRKG